MDWRNDKAIFLQAIELFKKNVVNGVYKPGTKIPSVREYALILGINPNTVVKVYEILTNEGLIEARGTTGYFLTSNPEYLVNLKSEIVKEKCHDFLKQMSELGFTKQEIIDLLKESDEDVIRMS